MTLLSSQSQLNCIRLSRTLGKKAVYEMSEQDQAQDFWIRETIALLALCSMKGVGYWTLFRLSLSGLKFNEVLRTESFSELAKYFDKAKHSIKEDASQEWLEFQKKLWAKGNELYRKLKKEGIRVVHIGQADFPQSLREIPEPPRWLFVQGNLSILHHSCIAIVGTRQPSEDGEFLARYVGACIPYFDFDAVTVSGLATGIDQIVHKQSIRFQTPTIAVLGNGIFKNYPSGSEKLRRDICDSGGAIVTEYLPYEGYSADKFVRRNRIQAGLSNVIIPVEWKSKSGTAHTVRYASDAGKPIICLKMPDWSEASHDELNLGRELGAKIFTIPGEETNFIDTVQFHLSGNLSNKSDDLEQQAHTTSEPKGEHRIKQLNKEETAHKIYGQQLTIWDMQNE